MICLAESQGLSVSEDQKALSNPLENSDPQSVDAKIIIKTKEMHNNSTNQNVR